MTGRLTASIAPDLLEPQRTPAAGLFASYSLLEYVDLDAAIDGGLKNDAAGSTLEGGHVVQVLVGAKAGVRRDRFGMFLKLRGGVNTGALAFATLDAFRNEKTFTRQSVGALDMGGVLEAYVSPRVLLRIDAGDVKSAHGTPVVLQNGRAIGPGGTPTTHSIQMSTGVGLRF